MNEKLKYDIALSFAGEERDYVDRVANLLKERGVKVFYDLFEEDNLWGKELYSYLSDIYHKHARFTVMFISKAYARKLWTNQERKSAQARAFQSAQEYILPARFDDTEIPGILPTTGYVSLKDRSPEDLASLIMKKLISSGGSTPTELVRRDFSTVARHDAGVTTKFCVIVKDDQGTPIKDCDITLQADNGTYNSVRTNDHGDAIFDLNTRKSTKLLVSHPTFPAAIYDKVDPDGTMEITLPRANNLGSVTMHRTGFIPGLKGSLNPILDTSNRTYLYARNISINNGQTQPVTFEINVPLELEDADGVIVYATVKHISGDLSLLQYTKSPLV